MAETEKTMAETIILETAELERLTRYYEALGLVVLRQDSDSSSLGIQGSLQEAVVLRAVSVRREEKRGRLIFQLPERKDLGNSLYSLLLKKLPISGGEIVGGQERLYLEDPEGNSLAVAYGRIQGKERTDLDPDALLALRDEKTDRFLAATRIYYANDR